MQQAKTTDAAKYPTMYRKTSTTKNELVQNANSIQGGKTLFKKFLGDCHHSLMDHNHALFYFLYFLQFSSFYGGRANPVSLSVSWSKVEILLPLDKNNDKYLSSCLFVYLASINKVYRSFGPVASKFKFLSNLTCTHNMLRCRPQLTYI